VLAEERRLGTIETLLTTPVTTTESSSANMAPAYLLYLALWAATGGVLLHPLQVRRRRPLHRRRSARRRLSLRCHLGPVLHRDRRARQFPPRNQAVAAVLGFVMLVALIGGTNYLANSAWLDREVLTR